MKYIILIPAYKPNDKLMELLKEINNKYQVILVDDGSGSRYDKVFNEAKEYSHVIRYEENRGKGYALRIGLKYIDDNYKDYIVVTMDSDGQHKYSDALKLCDYVNKNDDTLALGKRKFTKDTPLRSRIGNYITRGVFKIVTKNKIYDTQTGLRAFSYKLMPYMLGRSGDRFEYEMNVLLGLRDNNIKYKELVIETIYYVRNGKTHFKTFKDAYIIYKNIFNYKRSNNGR